MATSAPETLTTVTLERRLRPLRLAFLVEPRRVPRIRRAIEINTILWGGKFNPLIPVYRKLPRGWTQYRRRSDTGLEVAKGYLRAFEPDYLVEMTPGLAKGLGFPQDRVLQEVGVVDPNRQDQVHCGVNVSELYRWLYEREYQFVRRHPEKVVLPEIGGRAFQLFSAAWFGAFPRDDKLSYVRTNYREGFGADPLEVTTANAFEYIFTGLVTPLQMGSRNLETRGRNDWENLTLFVLNPSAPIDVIDYWNLRAVGWPIVPLPYGWATQMMGACDELIKRAHSHNPWNPKVTYGTRLLKSRSLAKSEFDSIAGALSPGAHRLTVQHWYPRIWNDFGRNADHVARLEVAAKRVRDEVSVDPSRRISFQDIGPDFLDDRYHAPGPGWATVAKLRSYRSTDLATVFPQQLDNINRLFQTFGPDWAWMSSEGITFIANRIGWPQYWTLPRGVDVFASWAQALGLQLEVSSAGRTASQVVRSLGGLIECACIGYAPLIDKLDEMAGGVLEKDVTAEDEADKRRSRAGTISLAELRGLLARLHQQDHWVKSKSDTKDRDRARASIVTTHLNTLVERNVLRLGVRVQCTHCQQHNWYPLDRLASRLVCERCLQEFAFPAYSPESQAQWHYRPIGPFAIEGYAQGAYCVVQALRFLALQDDHDSTWIPGFELKGGQLHHEVDFAMLKRPRRLDSDSTVLVLGECKAGEKRFSDKGRRTAVKVMRLLPGVTFAFCTTRESLDAGERRMLSAIAMRGRKVLSGENWTNPVIILTRHELEGDGLAPLCWKKVAGYTDETQEDFHRLQYQQPGLSALADITQRLHLRLEPFEQTRHRMLEEMRARYLARRPRGT